VGVGWVGGGVWWVWGVGVGVGVHVVYTTHFLGFQIYLKHALQQKEVRSNFFLFFCF
jgi:hypothetical protein